MADGRMLKKAISTSRRLAELKTDSCRLLYTWLIPHLDVEGRFYGDPALIKGSVVPRLKSFTEDTILENIIELAELDLIIIYQVSGDRYLELTNFEKHQTNLRKDREGISIIPAPNGDILGPEQLRSSTGVDRPKLREVKLREEKIYAQNFVMFWSKYPRKKSKGDAERAFRVINPDKELMDKILNALEVSKKSNDWLKDNGQFIPYPASWLRARGWEDEETTIQGKNTTDNKQKIYEANQCHARSHGTCRATWDNHKDNLQSMCHWCQKFESKRGEIC